MGIAIVAIPEENDRVWKFSSEKVPHLTLLFLGEDDSHLEDIVQFVDHAITTCEHGPFYLEVDHRGTLGPEDADVLFFSKRNWNIGWVKQFRGQLLQNQQIRSAYDTAKQFGAPQEWTPHLTLGYPQTPAKPFSDDDHPLYSVAFDRIAVWSGDYDGPDFRLEWPDREFEGDLAVAYSDAQKAALMHFGVKGMQWGKRKTEMVTVGGQTKQVTPKKAAKLDKTWQQRIYSLPGALDVHNGMADHFNARIGAVNDKYNDADFTHTKWDDSSSWSPREKQYHDEITALATEGTRLAVQKVHGTSPTGKLRAELNAEGDHITVHEVKIKHATDDNADAIAILKLTRNGKGLITQAEPLMQEDSMSQTSERGGEFLEHHGVKGMRWGIRKEQVGTGARSAARGLGKALVEANKVIGDAQFETMAEDGRARTTVESRAHTAFHRTDLPNINNKPKYQKAKKLRNRLRHPRDPLTKQYRNEVKTTYINRLEEAANSLTNVSGTRQYTIRERGWELPAQGGGLPQHKYAWAVTTRAVEHADASTKPFFVELVTDDDGFITELRPIESAAAVHGAIFVEGLMHGVSEGEAFVLEHYGIKGMHWGQRKSTPEAVSPTASSVVPHGSKRRTKIAVEGGENHPASADALKVEQARAKLKKSGPKSLSNQELKQVAERLRLEQQAIDLDRGHSRISQGRKFVKSLTSFGKEANDAANTSLQTANLARRRK